MIYYVLIVMLNFTFWKSKAFGGVAQRQSNGLLNRGSRYRNSPSPPKVRKNLNPSAKDVKGEVFRYIPIIERKIFIHPGFFVDIIVPCYC